MDVGSEHQSLQRAPTSKSGNELENSDFLSIKYSDIPTYLRDSSFFTSLADDSPEEYISIPEKCYRPTDELVESIDDFARLLRVTMFWDLYKLPRGIMDFCHRYPYQLWWPLCLEILDPDRYARLQVYRGRNTIEDIIETGNLADLLPHWISENGPFSEMGKQAVKGAANLGALAFLQVLCKNTYALTSDACAAAAKCGSLECLQYLHEQKCPWEVDTLTAAAWGGHLHCLKYAHEQGLRWDKRVCTIAASKGHMECLRYARDNGCPWDAQITSLCAQSGNIATLQYALDNGCTIHKDACFHASAGGHLDCLQLLQAHNAAWTAATTLVALKNNHFECLRFAHEHYCPWNEQFTAYASKTGNLEILRYAMERGCPYDERVLLNAAENGHLNCLQYLIDVHGLFMSEDGSMFGAALENGNYDCVCYLIDCGCPFHNYSFPERMENAANGVFTFNGTDEELLKCIEYAQDRGWRCSKSLIDYVHLHDLRQCNAFLDSNL